MAIVLPPRGEDNCPCLACCPPFWPFAFLASASVPSLQKMRKRLKKDENEEAEEEKEMI
jgi:hypothetical protein